MYVEALENSGFLHVVLKWSILSENKIKKVLNEPILLGDGANIFKQYTQPSDIY